MVAIRSRADLTAARTGDCLRRFFSEYSENGNHRTRTNYSLQRRRRFPRTCVRVVEAPERL